MKGNQQLLDEGKEIFLDSLSRVIVSRKKPFQWAIGLND